MIADDPVNVMIRHVGQCDIVSLQKAEPRVIVMKIQGIPHPRRHLINKAEDAAVFTGAVLIHQPALKFQPEILHGVFFDLQFPILRFLIGKSQLKEFRGMLSLADHNGKDFLTDHIPVIKNILHLLPVHQKQAVARFDAEFFSNGTGRNLTDLMCAATLCHDRIILMYSAAAEAD